MAKEINNVLIAILSLILSLVTSAFLTKLIIKNQERKKVYQPLRDELRGMHAQKKNTPTGGGLAIFISSLLPVFIFCFNELITTNLILILLIFSGFFLVGFIDDTMKVFLKDYHGLKESYRIFLEIILAFVFLKICGFSFHDFQYFNLFGTQIFLGLIAILIFSLIFVGSANAMNLSDGLDGLATCLFIIALMPFVIYSFKANHIALGIFLVSVFGSCIGFLIFNMHPSKIFMGDSGSLYLGSILGGSAIFLHLESILMLSGIVLIIETLSVIIQVIFFKLTGKRVFLMAPLHHHFELKGFSEEKVVLVFIVLGYIFSFISVVIIL